MMLIAVTPSNDMSRLVYAPHIFVDFVAKQHVVLLLLNASSVILEAAYAKVSISRSIVV